jgi:hypothetical protein
LTALADDWGASSGAELGAVEAGAAAPDAAVAVTLVLRSPSTMSREEAAAQGHTGDRPDVGRTCQSLPSGLMDDSTAAQDLRVSNAEREHVGELLTNHYAAGRLSTEEYAERSDSAARAVTRKELTQVLVDLPGANLPDSLVGDVIELTNTAGDLRRDGAWMVPSRIRVQSRFGNARLDFRSARFTAPVVTVEVDLAFGNLDIRLPEGATIDLDGARTGIGTIIDKTVRSFERGTPHLIVRGGTRVGNVRVRR